MLKKLIGGAIAILLMLSMGYCETLSLGDISVISGLDQKLKAYIQVNNLPKDNQAITWQVSGDEMGKSLSGLKYALETKDDMASLQVTSQQPIHSPVVTLNVLANEGQEQIAASEYTVLLDPVTKPIPVDMKQYGPIARGEKLSEVAEKVKPNYITVENAANALFYANPHAFENNDSSKLIPGSYLVIPEFSPGVSTLGQNNINEKRFDDIEEQLDLVSQNVSNIDLDTKRQYDELSAYTLQLETLVTKLDSRLADLEGKTAFLSEDLNQLSKKQETSINQVSTRINQNKSLISKLEAESTQRWYYLIAAVILVILIIVIFLWWKKRREVASHEEIVLEDYPLPNNTNTEDKGEDKPKNKDIDKTAPNVISDIDDSEEPITSEVIEENKDKVDTDFIKDDEYHSRFIKDDQEEENVFLDESDEQELRKVLEEEEHINTEEEQESEEEIDIPNAKEESIKDEVNIVLGDDEDDYSASSSDTRLSILKDDEIVESNVNEFELDDEKIKSTSLNDLEKALEEQIKLKEKEEAMSNIENEEDMASTETDTLEIDQESENDTSEKKSTGLKLAPLDLTDKK